MPASHTAIEIFCSYAQKDAPWLSKLEMHLSLLKQQGLITLWHNRQVMPGTDWAHDIDTHLYRASIILLLISADFLASNYHSGIEMRRALERQEAGEARVIPILVRPVGDWQSAPFASLQPLPTDAKPLATRSNKDAALADVAAGIRRVITDLPLLMAGVSRTTLPEIWTIPYPRNPFFLGRDRLLSRLRTQLQAGQAMALSQPQAISGLGGIGKTQVAVEYAYRYHQEYRAVLWARADSQEALVSSYVTLANRLDLPGKNAPDQSIVVQAVKAWLQNTRGWLLILDNADELALVSAFVPPAMGGHLLLTTRATALGRLAHRIEVETFSPEDGTLFLLRRAGLLAPDASLVDAASHDYQDAIQMTKELGGLPLALDQVGAYLEETGCSLANYQQMYRQHRRDLLKKRGGLVADHPEPVATTWSLSFARVQEQNPAAADLLRFCAYLAPDAIPLELLTQGATQLGEVLGPVVTDVFQFDQAIEVLRAYSLLRRDPMTDTLSIHRLVQVVVQDAMMEQEQALWRQQAIQALNMVYPEGTHEARKRCERLTTHVLIHAMDTSSDAVSLELAAVQKKAADYLSARAQYEQAELLYQRSRHIREEMWGTEHPEVASVLNGLANLYREQSKYNLAEPLYQRALRIREQMFGPEHSEVAVLLNGLARLYREQGKYEQAEPLYQRALRISEQTLGSDHPDVTSLFNNLAELYRELGKYEQAEPLYRRALHIREQILGPEHPDVASPLNGLANLYRDQDEYERAEPLYQRALQIWEQALGPEHPLVASSLNGLALLYQKQGKHKQAESRYQQARDIWERALGPEHPDVTSPLNGLAALYQGQREYEQAESLYRRALSIRERTLGPEHPRVASPLNGLAELYQEQGKYDLAGPLYQRAVHIWEQALGPEHPRTQLAKRRYAMLLHEMGRDVEIAEPDMKHIPPS
jgi:tetratricopeptide (TPR) repeat protein